MVSRLGEPRTDVKSDPWKERAARLLPGRSELLLGFGEATLGA